MKDPKPINLKTTEEIREAGWQAESRDADGHLIGMHAPIYADDEGIAEWIVECTEAGETVTEQVVPNNTLHARPLRRGHYRDRVTSQLRVAA